MSDDLGEPVMLLLPLPRPISNATTAIPLLVTETVNKPHNDRVRRWWSGRTQLSAVVVQLQHDTCAQTTASQSLAAEKSLYNSLANVQRMARKVELDFEPIIQHFYVRGARAKATATPFILRWQMPRAHVYNGAPASADDEQHASAALVFELVCLIALQIACLQQSAVFAEFLWRKSDAQFDIDIAETHLNNAQVLSARLLTDVLPLYVCLLTGTESYLLSEHFHRDYVQALIAGHRMHLSAIRTHITTGDALTAASLFETAAYNYSNAARTIFGSHAERCLMYNRRASALLSLSQHLVHIDADRTTDALLSYNQRGSGLLPGAALLEALYCARAASAIRAGTMPNIEEQCETIERLLKAKHGANIPSQSASRRAAEFETVQILCGATPESGVVLCMHPRALTYVVAFGVVKRIYQI